MIFPLKKEIFTNSSATEFLTSYKTHTEIPLGAHPGAFSTVRKNHQHEGIDLYCEPGDEVYAIESGTVVAVAQFTGANVNSPWWANTHSVMIEGASGVFNYGEITTDLKVGQKVSEGQVVAHVKTVLKKDKGRPMTMLHLELYQPGTKSFIPSWPLGKSQPTELLDPTALLLRIKNDGV